MCSFTPNAPTIYLLLGYKDTDIRLSKKINSVLFLIRNDLKLNYITMNRSFNENDNSHPLTMTTPKSHSKLNLFEKEKIIDFNKLSPVV